MRNEEHKINADKVEDPLRLRFGEWSMINPLNSKLQAALHTARYNLKNLTKSEAYLICGAAECYCHLAAHPTSTKNVIAQLRQVRNVVRNLEAIDEE